MTPATRLPSSSYQVLYGTLLAQYSSPWPKKNLSFDSGKNFEST